MPVGAKYGDLSLPAPARPPTRVRSDAKIKSERRARFDSVKRKTSYLANRDASLPHTAFTDTKGIHEDKADESCFDKLMELVSSELNRTKLELDQLTRSTPSPILANRDISPMARSTPIPRPVRTATALMPDKFSGEGEDDTDFADWSSMFFSYAEINQWDKGEHARFMGILLRGRARKIW